MAFLRDDVAEDLRGKLLTLIVADHTDLDPLFVAKILMIVHLTSNKGISPFSNGRVKQEITCPTTNGHLPNRTSQQFVAHRTLHIEGLFHRLHEVVSCEGAGQFTYHTTPCLDAIHRLGGKKNAPAASPVSQQS